MVKTAADQKAVAPPSIKDGLTKTTLVKDSLSKNTLLKDSLIKDSLPVRKPEVPIKIDTTITTFLPAVQLYEDTLKHKAADSLIKKADSAAVKTVVKKTDNLVKKTTGNQPAKAAAAAGNKTNSNKGVTVPGKGIAKDSLVKDSIPFNPLDTVQTRIIKAHHKVRVYKSNMQAVADSLFYTNADSTLRWYVNPILWSQGSQQTGDTIYLRLKNKKLNTLQVIQKGFMVNVNADSAKFNQIKGKLITAFFKDGELNTMFVDGNAESVYYNRDKDSVYTEMNQTISSRIKIFFKNKEINEILNIKDPEGIRVPIKDLKEDVILTGFIWKPELRPLSKKEVINGKPKAKPGAKGKPAVTGKDKNGKPIAGKTDDKNKVTDKIDALKNALGKELPGAETIKKEVLKAAADNPKVIDSLKAVIPVIKDSLKVDSVIKKLAPAPAKKQ